MILLFSLTMFLSAALLFTVEPMIGKLLLPLVGGSPSVWNTCLMFFQGVLLLGYGYAYVSTQRLGVRRQAVLHVVVLLLPLVVLPIRITGTAVASLSSEGNPIPALLGFLAVATGLPLFVLSTTAPLLQRWFANTGHVRACDPYFLYAASNAGSLVGLLSYPFLIEPSLSLKTQCWVWAAGYVLLMLLILVCVVVLRRTATPTAQVEATSGAPTEPIGLERRLRWVLLAFAPSSLLLGVTTYLTTDVAPFPLLWVLPLALYLLTFILVFARRPVATSQWLERAVCGLAIVLIATFLTGMRQPPSLYVIMHLAFFFLAALICHSTLAKDRPAPEHLTEYYLCMSFGGVLGGIFNALLAPILFPTVLEYPLVAVLACALRPSEEKPTACRAFSWRDIAWGLGTAAFTFVVIAVMQRAGIRSSQCNAIWMFGLPGVIALRFVKRPLRYGLCVAGILSIGAWYTYTMGRSVYITRNFFGILSITVDTEHKFRQLMHGTTLHGRAWIDPKRETEPTAYFFHNGPAGQFFASFNQQKTNAHVAVIGLGAGALASYARPGEDWTFYEIDPDCVRIACNPRRFPFLQRCVAKRVGVVLGDARLQLHDAAPALYDLIVLDAFSSDSIPSHLITREALRLYLDKLRPDGRLLFHISNRRLRLEPVVANLAHDAGLVAFSCTDGWLRPSDVKDGKEPSQWVVLAKRREDLGSLPADSSWVALTARPGLRLWTDDFSNILQVIRWD